VSPSERQLIEDALDHLAAMRAHQERGSLDDTLILDAVCLRLASAIDALSRLPQERRQHLFGEDWHAMWATRNYIAHAYLRIDVGIIAATLEHNIPPLVDHLRQTLAEHDS
jgi:uncharacterized protein with HEPN domain